MISLIFFAAQWHALYHYDRSGCWQTIEGPALIEKMQYDPAMKIWEVLEEGGWTTLRDGDTITVDSKGVVRVRFAH